MNNSISVNYNVLSLSDLDAETQILIQKAENACERAYAPYSKFNVGAAILLDNGTVVCGSNVENVSYSLTNCAERIALQFAKTNYPDNEMQVIAIAANGDIDVSGNMFSPCGACRQVMLELELQQKSAIRVLLKQPNNKVLEIASMKDLLPLGFGIK